MLSWMPPCVFGVENREWTYYRHDLAMGGGGAVLLRAV
jgi:hypothetical protein